MASSNAAAPSAEKNPIGPDEMYTRGILKGSIKLDQKLEEDNYRIWSMAMKLNLEAKLLWPMIIGSAPDFKTRPNDYSAWKFDDVQTRMWTFNNCKILQQSHLEDSESANESWDIWGFYGRAF
ncbi:hypothetical protein MMC22_000617 [Lobaria immixta]|nr:hypothetical protein [Lobaria immixta]